MTDTGDGKRVDEALRSRPPGLWPFVPAGFPDLATTADLLAAMGRLPVRGIEIGFPFSDPVADGPVIQSAFSHALAVGTRVAGVFETIAAVRGQVGCPLLAMVSASIVYRVGPGEFVERARDSGLDGLIVPDLSLEEAPGLAEAIRAASLRLVMLVAPTTPPDRQQRIAAAASGFLYYVSVQGTTGARDDLPAALAEDVTRLRQSAGLPVVVGFGIGWREQVRRVCGFADGAIVGSALVGRMAAAVERGAGRAEVVFEAAQFIRDLCDEG